LTWRPSTATDFDIAGYFQRFSGQYGPPVIGDRPANLPRERSFLDPNDPRTAPRAFRCTDLNHRMNDTGPCAINFLFGNLKSDTTFINQTRLPRQRLQTAALNRNIFGQSSDSENYSTIWIWSNSIWAQPVILGCGAITHYPCSVTG
jgi:iron complex outermembrane receptor protein